jgi:HAD superfamily hydrolase (TIGR01549 family)
MIGRQASIKAVSFDFGQTLADFDHEFLARRVAERGAELDLPRALADTPAAWLAYGEAKRRGAEGKQGWTAFMKHLLEHAVLPSDGSVIDELVNWLWTEQPKKNLWRRQVPGMFELARDLAAASIPVAIVSNSEGRLAELVAEIEPDARFGVIADSGKLGFEKPDPRIFRFAAQQIGVEARELVHVGDAWETDVRGALEVGAKAVWFAPTEQRALPEDVVISRTADELRKLLRGWGAQIPA